MACTASTSGTRSQRELLEDCMCTICRSILIHPVTLPCAHELCMPCFKQTVEEASLCCPLCRTRISTWARRASKANALVDERRWKEVQSLFPLRVQRRLNGLDDDTDDDEDDTEDINARYRQMIHLSKPGEIRQEFEEELKRLTAQQEEEKRQEEEASVALIRRLQTAEEREAEEARRRQEEIAARDEELAQRLAEANSPDTPLPSLKSGSGSRKSSVDSDENLSVTGLQERGRKQLRPNDGSKTLETFFRRLPPGVRPAARCSSVTRNRVGDPHLDQWLKDTLSDRPGSAPVSGRVSATDVIEELSKKDNCDSEIRSESQQSERKVVKHKSLDERVQVPPPSCSKSCSDGLGESSVASVNRNDTEERVDGSDSQCFKPIKSSPKTPPKKLPTGQHLQPSVIIIRPHSHSSPSESGKDSTDLIADRVGSNRVDEHLEQKKMGTVRSKLQGSENGLEERSSVTVPGSVTAGPNLTKDSPVKQVPAGKPSSVLNTPPRARVSSQEASRSPYSRPSISDYRQEHHSVPDTSSSPRVRPLDADSRERSGVHHALNKDHTRSPEPKPSTSASVRPVGIFNPATVPQWSESLYAEPTSGKTKSSSRAGSSHGVNGQQSSPPAKQTGGKRNAKHSGRKLQRQEEDEEGAPVRPAKIPRLSSLDCEVLESTKSNGDSVVQSTPEKKGHVRNGKGKLSPSHSKHSPRGKKSRVDESVSDNLALSSVQNGAAMDASPSNASVISVSSVTSSTSEDTVEGGEKKKRSQRTKKASSNNPSASKVSDTESENITRGPQRSIKDWFSPKESKTSHDTSVAANSTNSAASQLKRSKSSNLSQNCKKSKVSSSASSSTRSCMSSEELSPAGKPAQRSSHRSVSKTGKCNCCATETCTSGKLDKFLSTSKLSSPPKTKSSPVSKKGTKHFTSSSPKPMKRKMVFTDDDSSSDDQMSDNMMDANGKKRPKEEDDTDDEEAGLTQEERDLRLAQKLQAEFDLADKLSMNVIRFKGSDNEYSLRRGHPSAKH